MLGKVGNVVFFILFLTNILAQEMGYSERGDFFTRLLHNKNGPVVVFLQSDKFNQELSGASLTDNQIVDNYEAPTGEKEAYLLYHALRTTQETEDLDTKAARIFNKTQILLRTAFIGRCQQRSNCEQKCPSSQSKNSGCQANCQKVFDELDACEDTQPKCGQKDNSCGGGKTMPPRWLRSLTTLEWHK